MTRSFQIVLGWRPKDQVWVSLVPGLADLSSQGETRELVLENTREAILGYLEAAAREGIAVTSDLVVELVEVTVAV